MFIFFCNTKLINKKHKTQISSNNIFLQPQFIFDCRFLDKLETMSAPPMSYAARAAAAASLKPPTPPVVVPLPNPKLQVVDNRKNVGDKNNKNRRPQQQPSKPFHNKSPKQITKQTIETKAAEELVSVIANLNFASTPSDIPVVIKEETKLDEETVDKDESLLSQRAETEARERGYSEFPLYREPQDIRLPKKYVYYYHLPNNPDWFNISSYRILHSVETVGQAIMLSRNIPSLSIYHCYMTMMREGVLPMWEHALNRNGGYLSLKVSTSDIDHVWRNMTLQLCGGGLFSSPELEQKVNGITISPKRQFYIVKIWMVDKEYVNTSLLRCDIHGMHRKTIQTGEHHPEFVM